MVDQLKLHNHQELLQRKLHCVKWNQQLWRKEEEQMDQHLKVMLMHPRLCRLRMFVFFFDIDITANIEQVDSSPPAAVPDEHVASSTAHVSINIVAKCYHS